MSSATFLEWARVELNRGDPHEADQLHRDGGLLVDIRPHHTRLAEGEIPGAVGLRHATDLIEGYHCWVAAGMPTGAGATEAIT